MPPGSTGRSIPPSHYPLQSMLDENASAGIYHDIWSDENLVMDMPQSAYYDFYGTAGSAAMENHAPMPTNSKPHRKPLGHKAHAVNAMLQPPSRPVLGASPNKQKKAARPPLGAVQVSRLNTVSIQQPMYDMRQTDSIPKKPMISTFQTSASVNGLGGFGNVMQTASVAGFNLSNPPRPYIPQPIHQKRPASHMEDPFNRSPKKAKKSSDQVEFDPRNPGRKTSGPHPKPDYSYAQLIARAIDSTTDRKMTLHSIYQWISSNFPFYQMKETGWQNSIRHNLSLQKHFRRVERGKNDPGKGSYWVVDDGALTDLLKPKTAKKLPRGAENLPVMSTRLEPSHLILTPHQPIIESLPPLKVSQPLQVMPLPADRSSDATIIASDDTTAEEADLPSSPNVGLPRSPTTGRVARLCSSPFRSRHPVSSLAQGAPKFLKSEHDSGYLSGLNSSVMKNTPYSQAQRLTTPRSDRISQGSAEFAIAAVRGHLSSSPRPYELTSSPSRPVNGLRAPPLTPHLKLMPPRPQPPSVSPNTNLRKHRKAVDEIASSHGAGLLPQGHSSPYAAHCEDFFNEAIEFGEYSNTDAFSIFEDGLHGTPGMAVAGRFDMESPTKRVAKRLLGGATASPLPMTSTPKFMATANSANLVFDTPSKVFSDTWGVNPSSPSAMLADNNVTYSGQIADFYSWQLPDDHREGVLEEIQEVDEEEGGFDICKGFPPIASQTDKENRPATAS